MRPDNKFFSFMSKLGDIILLNVLFIITSIPIVTIGVSLTALYTSVKKKNPRKGVLHCQLQATFINKPLRIILNSLLTALSHLPYTIHLPAGTKKGVRFSNALKYNFIYISAIKPGDSHFFNETRFDPAL